MSVNILDVVTDNSVYQVIDHEYSTGASVKNMTKGGKLAERESFSSVRVVLVDDVPVLYATGGDHGLWLRSSRIQSIVRVNGSADRMEYTPIRRSAWLNIKLTGRTTNRRLTTVR